jgi:pyruvate,water dikinase
VGEIAVVAAHTVWQYAFLRRRVERFEKTADEFAESTEPRLLEKMSLSELRIALARFMEIRCRRWNDAALADAAAMVCYATLDHLLRRAYPVETANPRMALLKAIPDVVSGKPAHELWTLSRRIRSDRSLQSLFEREDPETILRAIEGDQRFVEFRRMFHAYLDAWGFRCSAELMLTVPSFQEAPAPVIEMLRAYARLDGDSPADAHARQARERERETTRVLDELSDRPLFGSTPIPTMAGAVRLVLGWTHASIRFRERARLKQALLYSRCRRIALAIGAELERRGFLDRADDVFWLTVAEVDELASGGAMFPHRTRELVTLRVRAHAEAAAIVPPPTFELGEAEYLPLEHAPADHTAVDSNALVLEGTPACGGRVTARAVVLADVREMSRLERGDILVTKQTDPGWAPAFFLISGLVVERGGMLSHGAIVAREFGIPCSIGVRGATTRIASGSTITLDGGTGHVYLG